MLFDLLVIILPIIIPYTLLGENLGAIILAIIACVYLLVNNKEIRIEKRYFFITLSLAIISILTQIFISPYIESISGSINYLNILLYYLELSLAIKSKGKYKILKGSSLVISISSIYYIIVQGLYYDVRIYGNIGYANSYGLLLLVAMYLDLIRSKDKYTEMIDIVYVTGILFTGSRLTIILLIIYLILRIKRSISNKNEDIFNIFLPIIFAVIQYTIYSELRLLSIIVVPILIFIYYVVSNIKKSKTRKYLLIISIISFVILMLFNKSNTFERIKNISLSNGSLQERFTLFEDAAKVIINNPFGNGINVYKYKLYDDASAFYDVKYIHNSLLQTSYDIGVVGGIILLLIRVGIKIEYYLMDYIFLYLYTPY